MRIGFSTYLVFPLSLLNTIIVTYYLLISNLFSFKVVFPNFIVFFVFGAAVGLPLEIFFGWLHFKRTYAYGAEANIGVEANPYYYKAALGIQKDFSISSQAFLINSLVSLMAKTKCYHTKVRKMQKTC